jgi:hypothetical protein
LYKYLTATDPDAILNFLSGLRGLYKDYRDISVYVRPRILRDISDISGYVSDVLAKPGVFASTGEVPSIRLAINFKGLSWDLTITHFEAILSEFGAVVGSSTEEIEGFQVAYVDSRGFLENYANILAKDGVIDVVRMFGSEMRHVCVSSNAWGVYMSRKNQPVQNARYNSRGFLAPKGEPREPYFTSLFGDCLRNPQLDRSQIYGVLGEFQSIVNAQFGLGLAWEIVEEFGDAASPQGSLVRKIDQMWVGEYGKRRFARMISVFGITLETWLALS